MDSRPTRVFISYSHDSQEHKAEVLALCDRLRGDGLEAHLDQYQGSPQEGWPRWMRRQIEDADYVLLVCTEIYERRFKGKEHPTKGRGVAWEGAILTQELYDSATRNERFIPVLLRAGQPKIPIVLRGVTRYDLSSETDYDNLYRRLTAQPAIKKPDLGKLRTLAPEDRL